MKSLDFFKLKEEVAGMENLNEKRLRLYEARANCQQDFLFTSEIYLRQIDSEIERLEKVNELSAPVSVSQDGIFSKSRNLKVTISIVFEILKMINKGKNVNDSTVLSSFISLISGFSYDYILNTIQKGFYLSEKHHGSMINEANDVLGRLGLPIQIDTNKQY